MRLGNASGRPTRPRLSAGGLGGPRLSAGDLAGGRGTGGWGGAWALGQRFVCDFGCYHTRNRRQRRFPTRGRPGAAGHESWLRHSGTARTRSYGVAAAFMLLPAQTPFSQWAASARHVPINRTQDTPAPSASRFVCAEPNGNAMKPRIQCVLTHWMSGFTASGGGPGRGRERDCGREADGRRTARNPGPLAWAGQGTRVPVRRALLPHRGGGAAAVLGAWAAR